MDAGPVESGSAHGALMLTKREFLGEETWKRWKQDEERLLQFRNEFAALKRKPDQYERAQLALNKVFIDGYKRILYD